ncbi:MAG: isocitrate/isopropylmalate family dehydrogenase, partial [Christensenellales bacterium]
ANPIATVLCAAMMLRNAFSLHQEADHLEEAVFRALQKGLRTADIAASGREALSCSEMTQAIVDEIG